MSSLFKELLTKVDQGRSGKNIGLPTGLPAVDKHTLGMQRGNMVLIGAETSVGKTKFSRYCYMYYPYHYWKIHCKDKFNLHFIDITLEQATWENTADHIVRDFYLKDNTPITRAKLLSMVAAQEGKEELLSDELYDRFLEHGEEFGEFEGHCTVLTDASPSLIEKTLMDYAKANGEFENPNALHLKTAGAYRAKNPDDVLVIHLDTINQVDLDKEHPDVKRAIDRSSRLISQFCKRCGFVGIILQQFNAEISSTDRSRFGISTPLVRDFEDSKRPTKDGDVILALFDPERHEMKTLSGYQVDKMNGWFRSLHILKNRNGFMNVTFGLQFIGSVGVFRQLPSAKEFASNPSLYAKYTKL
jgi:hypothetical protein